MGNYFEKQRTHVLVRRCVWYNEIHSYTICAILEAKQIYLQ